MKKIILVLLATVFASSAHAVQGDMFNFRFDPVGLLYGAYGIDLDITVAKEWTLGPELNYLNFTDSSDSSYFSSRFTENAYSLGVRANWFRNGALHTGLYVGPSLSYIDVNVKTNDLTGNAVTGSTSGMFLRALVGYAWFWDSFNIMLGGGANVGLGTSNIKVTTSNGTQTVSTSISGLALEFSLGFTF